jgi:tetratricopeptide (TPR) repeat protein
LKIIILTTTFFGGLNGEEDSPIVYLDGMLWSLPDLFDNQEVASIDAIYDWLPFRREVKIESGERACHQRLFEITQELSAKNNLLVSAILNQALIKANPENPGYYYELGRTYYKMQSWDKASEMLQKTLELVPDDVDAKLILAYVYLSQFLTQDDLHESRRLFQEVLAVLPTYGDAQTGLKRVEILLGILPKPDVTNVSDDKEPIRTYTDEKVTEFVLYASIAKDNPEQPQYFYELGRYYMTMEAWDQAINAFHRSLELQPDNLDAKVQLAYAHLFRYLSRSRLIASKHLFEQVLAVSPGYTDAKTGLKRVNALLDGEPPTRVVESPLQPKLETQEDFCRAILVDTAQQLTEQKNYWGAILLYQELVKIYPNNAQYFYQLGRLYSSAQSWDHAIEAFNESLRLQPDNPDARLGAAYGYLLRYSSRCDLYDSESLFEEILGGFPYYHDAQEGLRRAESLIRLFPTHQEPRAEEPPKPDPEQEEIEKKKALLTEWQRQAVLIAKFLSRNGDYDGAARLYLELIEVFPKISDYYFELGVQFARMERRCAAIEAFRQTLEIKPDHSDALVALGAQYFFYNCYPLSFEMYSRAAAAAPKDPNAWLGLARSEQLLNNPREADIHFRQALNLDPENIDFYKAYASFLLGQKRYIESETFYQGLVNLENNDEPYRSSLFYIGGYTSPSFFSRGGGAVEMEKDLFNSRWSTSLTTTAMEGGVIYPFDDRFRLTVRGRWIDVKQRNLIAKATVFDAKVAGAGVRGEWVIDPYWNVTADAMIEWVDNNNNFAQLKTHCGTKFEPSLLFKYNKGQDTIFFGEITDSWIFKYFDKHTVTVFTREAAIAGYQRDFNDQLYAGADVAWLWYQDPIHNQEQDINVWAQAGLPYFEDNLSVRYHSEYRQFRKETTGYYSFEYQWTHWLKFRWLKNWDFGGRCELLYWHGWRTTRGKNPQQQITTTALAVLAPVVTVENQIDNIFLTLGYTPNEDFDISATGNYYHDSFDYTVWGGKLALEWRF